MFTLASFCLVFIHVNHFLATSCVPLKASDTLRSSDNAAIIVDIIDDNVTVTLTVDDDSWVGAGFGSSQMENTYSIIASDTTTVEERKLGSSTGNNKAGTVLTNSLTILDDSIENNIRTIVCTRPITVGSDYYDFSSITSDGDQLTVIYGVGAPTTYAKHDSKGSKTLTFAAPTPQPSNLPTTQPTSPTSLLYVNLYVVFFWVFFFAFCFLFLIFSFVFVVCFFFVRSEFVLVAD